MGFLSSLFRKKEPPPVVPEAEEKPEPRILIRDSLVELHTSLPAKLDINKEAFEQFLLNLSHCHEPIAFELLGVPNRVTAQFVTCPADEPLVRRQLQAYFPEAMFQTQESTLEQIWNTGSGEDELVVEFGLEREFMFPLASGKLDPFIGIIGALSELQAGELGLFQVLFQQTQEDWPESVIRSVTHSDGKPFFVNMPELAKAAEGKVSKPLYAAIVRIGIKANSEERVIQLARDVAGAMRVFANPHGNALVPLTNNEYDFELHIEDLLSRQSRRSGMLLNSDELIGFVHLPSSAIRSPVLQRDTSKTKAAPKIVQGVGVLLGHNAHAGQSVAIRLTPEQRVRHAHIIGASGTGKSTLLFNLIRQDIEAGEGVAVLDPHGDLIDRILGVIPPGRIADVVLVDPSDEQFSIGFNILSAHSDLEKNLLASDLVSVFQRLSTSWGDQMGSVFQNAILAFLESNRRGTLADLRRFLIEPGFRAEFLKSVQDADVVYYWQKAFPQLVGNKSIGSIITRLDTFLAQKPIRYMVSQPENRLDFADITDNGRIFLAKLPEGLLGKENSHLLGTLLVSKFQQLAMSRQAKQVAARRDFWIYADEFHNYITPSMAEILSGARKYRIGLTLAHHELHQLQRNPDVASAVMSHPFTRIVFRVGDEDAKKLAEGFSSFEAKDLKNLEVGQAIARVERSDFDFNLSIPLPEEPNAMAAAWRQTVIEASRAKYATPRAEVEAMLAKLREPAPTAATPPSKPVVPKTAESPKPSEVPNMTVSEKEPVTLTLPVVPPAPEVPKSPVVPEPPRDLGRGGSLHKTIQARIQSEAEKLGFLAKVESQLAKDSNEAADLVLRKHSMAIAVEIAITTTVDHEFDNVKKCLVGGFERVVVLASGAERLKAIAAAVQAGLGSEQAAKVAYHTPDEFIAELPKLAKLAEPPTEAPDNAEHVTKGFKVRRHAPTLTADERKAKQEAAIRVMAESMKRKR